jgi:hypothetical protein
MRHWPTQLKLLAVAVLALGLLALAHPAPNAQAATFPCAHGDAGTYLVASTSTELAFTPCPGGNLPTGDGGQAAPGMHTAMVNAVNMAINACCHLVLDNLTWFLTFFAFYVAVRFGPAIYKRFKGDGSQGEQLKMDV